MAVSVGFEGSTSGGGVVTEVTACRESDGERTGVGGVSGSAWTGAAGMGFLVKVRVSGMCVCMRVRDSLGCFDTLLASHPPHTKPAPKMDS